VTAAPGTFFGGRDVAKKKAKKAAKKGTKKATKKKK